VRRSQMITLQDHCLVLLSQQKFAEAITSGE